jgi:uncharacterized membrane protein YfcA
VPIESLLVMALALGAGGLVKGATGMGLPLVALPILAAFISIPQAIAIAAVVGLLTNTWQVWRYRADMWTADFLPALLAGGAAGIAFGTWLLTALPERALAIVLATMVFLYVGLKLARPHFRLSRPAGRRLAPGIGLAAGALQGATGISAPIGVTFIHSLGLNRTAHVFAVSAMFLLFAAVQMPALTLAGIMTWPVFLQGLFALVPALLMMPVGAWLAERLSQAAFDRAMLALLAIVGLQLIVKGVAG